MVLAWDKDGTIPCFDHTLELSVKKFTDELETTLSKVRGLVGHFNHSTIAKNTLADIQKEMNKPQQMMIRMLRLGGDQHSKLAKYCTRIKPQ